MSGQGDEFMSRWSRRKAAAREDEKTDADNSAETTVPDEAAIDDKPGVAKERQGQEETESEAFADFDFDALDFESDYTQFMQANVPARIQRMALRRLWASNPVLANIDGLNDYDEDFTDAGLAKGAIQTAYKVGRGMLDEDDDQPDEEAQADDVEEPDTKEPTENNIHRQNDDVSGSEGEA